jgi:transposase
VLERKLSQKDAAQLMEVSYRQIKRIISKVKKHGDSQVVHQNRGKPSNRQISNEIKQKIIEKYQVYYYDFGATLAQEKLEEHHQIKISRESLRQILIVQGLLRPRKRGIKSVHTWRERKEHFGEMIQIDGSHHRWIADHEPFCLMGYIDDATGEIHGKFYTYEGTEPILDSFCGFVKKYGIPHSVYIDRHATYKINKKTSIAEDLQGIKSKTQFEMVMSELGVRVIHARSPQAKGRVERLFGTLQDRLVKELRLANVKNIQDANKFLVQYLTIYNKRFSVIAKSKQSFFKPIAAGFNYQWTFATRTRRVISNDYTIRYENKLFALQKPRLALKGENIMIMQSLNGELLFKSKFGALAVEDISHKVALRSNPHDYKITPLIPSVLPKDTLNLVPKEKTINRNWVANVYTAKRKPAVFCR